MPQGAEESPDSRLAGSASGDAPALPAAGVRPSLSLLWWLSLSIVVCDQLTKMMVLSTLPLYDSVTVIPNLVDFVHVQNPGVAFGFLNDVAHPRRTLITTALALAALVGIAFYARQIKPEERIARIGLSLILGGAIGNLIDRFRYGYVIDFVDVYWGGWHFWAFNVADAAISIGAVLIFLELLMPNRHVSHPV